jgi:predicted nucleotidyltransferase
MEDFLQANELGYGVRLLRVQVSGSQVFGWRDSDSDLDVRAIFAHPKWRYLSVSDWYEQISSARSPANGPYIDFEAWDVRKFLRKLMHSNPTALSWLHSPALSGNTRVCKLLDDVRKRCFNPWKMMRHFFGMGTEEALHIPANAEEITHRGEKACFYATRAALAAKWMCSEPIMPPLSIHELAEEVEHPPWVDAVLEWTQTRGSYENRPVNDIKNGITLMLAECNEQLPNTSYASPDFVDEMFRKILKYSTEGRYPAGENMFGDGY